ncbi:helix-turn-helix transcriptional regulator [Endozoicomonas euniceicola]|uniref:Helix-turn-helix transcriptional regulator n=1 Tax=Endozoicomonas euniceicola TaxID=1234143 RepID=A0ABY6GXH9_9GAMM|nr:helix-turn-helix transcriptional regulator [Endozoicomonas euniceicola]UYM17498.1 helix-turn-helix transcriptional regulator [Endozoicomonas euniceicola]
MNTKMTSNARDRLARLRAQKSQQQLQKTAGNTSVSKPGSAPGSREAMILELMVQVLKGDITDGQLLQQLRKQLLGLNQDRFAELVGVSRKTVSDIERGKGSPSQQVLNDVFKPFGLRAGIIPVSQSQTEKLINKAHDELLGG